VGNGFPVRTLFSYPTSGRDLTPFLLLDHAGPHVFGPTVERRGVGEHPHRGFETVTIVYEGEVEHRDSTGGGGEIGPGDVQWMTAAAGLVHAEFHGREFARRGGSFHMVQLWVNLPAKDKRSPPRYQGIERADIPEVSVAGGRATARVIAGELFGARGPAETMTPMHVVDLTFAEGGTVELELPEGHTAALVALRGSARAGGSPLRQDEVAVLSRTGKGVRVEGDAGAALLLLAGEPIDEPIAGQGPFVMNTADEIRQAIADYHSGKMGRLL
jgi:redox-sensitive bicupin YhaK (pirin superfamily)